MSKELVISANRHETKVAILEDDQLVEIYFQRANEYSLAGSVHKGRVTRVLPGMQSAFVDVGLERDTFLYVSDFFEEQGEDVDRVAPVREERVRTERAPRLEAPPVIEGIAPAAEEAAPSGERVERERPEDAESRDRRNRRSRRRRNRGRGFPDSKYAGGLPAEGEPAETQAEEERAEPAALQGSEFLLLPGESLAKYRFGGSPEAAGAAATPIEDEEAELGEVPEPDSDEGTEETEEQAEAEQAREEASEAFGFTLTDEGEQAQAAAEREIEPETPVEALAASAAIEREAAGGAATEAEQEEETQAAAEREEGTAAEAEETESGESGTAGESRREPALASRAEVMGRPEAGSAQVRGEPGGRYLHRGSRRMRRRGRGGAAARRREERGDRR